MHLFKLQPVNFYKDLEVPLKGKHQVHSKIVANSSIIEQVSHFSFQGWDVSYELDNDIGGNINKYQVIFSTIHKTLGMKIRKKTKLKFYKVIL